MTFSTTRLIGLLRAPATLLLLGFFFALSGLKPSEVLAQCVVNSSPAVGAGGTAAGVVAGVNSRGNTFTACADGEIASIQFEADFISVPAGEVHIYAGAPPFTVGAPPPLASEAFVPVVGLNTVNFTAPPAVSDGAVYTFVLVATAGQFNPEQDSPSAGVDCPLGACVALGTNNILYSISVNAPEISMEAADDAAAIVDGELVPSLAADTDFGEVEVGGTASTQTYRVNNDGSLDLSVSAINITGLNAADFSVADVDCLGSPVAPAGSCTFAVNFNPSDGGLRAATVEVINNDSEDASDETTYDFAIEGNGLLDFGDLPALYDPITTVAGVDPARHVAIGPILGSSRDVEADGQTSANAGHDGISGDDDAGASDDEDGVTFYQLLAATPDRFATFIEGSTVSISVELSGAGVMSAYLQGWIDANGSGSFGDAGENFVMNEVLSPGANLIEVDIPALTSGSAGVRFRVTSFESTGGFIVGVDGLEPDGEVEDYLVEVVATPTLIEIDMNSGDGRVDFDGTDIIYTDGQGNIILSVPLASLGASPVLDIDGGSGNSVLTISGPMAISGVDIDFDGGTGVNALIVEEAPVTATAVDHVFSNATDGTMSVACVVAGPCLASPTLITYANLAPILDNMSAVARTFDFASALDETITLNGSGDGVTGNGYSFIDSSVGGESVAFKNPTTSIVITSSGGGAESFILDALDTPLAGTFATLMVDGDAGADLFTVTPSEDYFIDIDGGTPTGTCPGDALTFDLTNGAIIDMIIPGAPGAGTVTFTTAHTAVTYTEIESIGDADVAISANYSILYATDDLGTGTELIITATNSGPNDVNCVTVAISAELDDWIAAAGFTATASGATSIDGAGSLWSIPTLAVGGTETLTITGLVTPNSPQDVTFTSSATQDSNADNDTATVVLSLGFVFPAKAHVNSAIYYDKSVNGGTDTYEALIVGLFQGSPGIDGAVWCKIPSEITGDWPILPLTPISVGDHWRPCSAGLPFPLHVNDLFEDSFGTLWLATWGSAGLYRSDNGGETWTAAEPGIGVPGGFAIVYTIVEDFSPGVLYISANNGLVFRSFNDGVTWQQVTSLPGVASDTPWSMASHPSESGTVYAGTFGKGVYVTEDFGFTWNVLDDAATLLTNENDALLDLDNSGDDFAGHIFDLEFSPDPLGAGVDHVLFAGTGRGVWRAVIDAGTASTFISGWAQLGPTVTLDDASTVTPEIRTLAFMTPSADTDEDLVAGSWGFGAFLWEDPSTSAVNAELTLRQGQVTFVAVSETGSIFVGSSTGETAVVTASAATATANEDAPTSELPEGYGLSQNYPNPFNPVTTIGFALPETGSVRLAVYDALGREVALLVDGTIQAGQHEVTFAAGNLPTGTYLYRLSTEAGTIARTLVLMK